MKKLKRQVKEKLKEKLTAGIMIHFRDLRKRDLAKMNKTVERKLNSLVNSYLMLQKKKENKKITTGLPVNDIVENRLSVTTINAVDDIPGNGFIAL